MSIFSMVGLSMARQRERTTARQDAASGGGEQKAALDKLTAFIPTEIVGIYVAGLGILSPATSLGKWSMFGICVLLIPVFMRINYLIQKKNDAKKAPTLRIWLYLVAFALVAFAAWAAALPGTPFLDFSPRATVIAGVAVIILAAFMYKVADYLDIVPKTS